MNFSEVPIGFGLALAQNEDAAAEMLQVEPVRPDAVPGESPLRNQILQKKFDMMTQHNLAKNPFPCHIIA